MTLREFFKFSWVKIIVMGVLLLFNSGLGFIIYLFNCHLQPTKTICLTLEGVLKFFTLPSILIGKLNIIPMMVSSKLVGIITALIIVGIGFLYMYFLSCLIVFLYRWKGTK